MQFIVKSLNCRDKHYEFDIAAVEEKDWLKFAKSVLLARTENVSTVSLTGFKAIIRDNVAKFKLCWKDSLYHEFECHLDVFGRESKNYSDLVSEIWQNIMTDCFGKSYNIALENKLKSNEKTI